MNEPENEVSTKLLHDGIQAFAEAMSNRIKALPKELGLTSLSQLGALIKEVEATGNVDAYIPVLIPHRYKKAAGRHSKRGVVIDDGIRDQVRAALQQGRESQVDIAQRLKISASSVTNIRRELEGRAVKRRTAA